MYIPFLKSISMTVVFFVLAFVVTEIIVAQEPDATKNATQSRQDVSPQSAEKTSDPQEKLSPQELKAIQIAKENDGPIFEYDQSGGFRRTAPNAKKPTPMFQLFADGRLVSRGSNFQTGDIETKLTQSELTEFLDLVVNKNSFYDIDMASIKKQMESVKQVPQIMDAPTATFAIAIQQGKKHVDVYALFHIVREYPKIKEIQQLARIEKRCNQIVSKIHLQDDGPEVLKVVNEAIAKQKPDFALVTMEELRLATRSGNGRFQVSFERQLPAHDGGPGRKANVIYFRASTDEKPIVTFYGFPQK